MTALEIVKSCPLFYELYDSEILKIVEGCKILTLEPGAVIFDIGDIGNEMFLVLSGKAIVEKRGVELAKLRKGDLFGEMVLLKENERKARVYSSSHMDIMVIHYDEIFGLFQNYPRIFSIIMVNLSRIFATRLAKAGELIEELKSSKNRKL